MTFTTLETNLLLEYLKTDSPSTYEVEAQKMWKSEAKLYADEIITDNYGNVVAIVRGTSKNNPKKVVIDAHCDEIGWIVKSINDDGYISVVRNGGTDNDITIGQKIKILTNQRYDDGGIKKVDGFFGWIPIHLKKKDNPDKPTEDNLFIDLGVTSKKDVEEMGVEIGNFIVVDRQPEILHDKYIIGKSLDDKIGGFILLNVLKELCLQKIKLPYDLYVVNSVQEEIGLRGAAMITETIKPDVAICFDVSFDTTTPLIDKSKYGTFKIGDGLVFNQGSDVHHGLLNLMKTVAKKNEIKHKLDIHRAGGTNTYSYYISNGGVVSGTVAFPLRYMHTPNELVALDDVELAIKYYLLLLQEIEENHDFKLF
jgi:putative aminopeptidase FrvX